jgi:hypothetical protein
MSGHVVRVTQALFNVQHVSQTTLQYFHSVRHSNNLGWQLTSLCEAFRHFTQDDITQDIVEREQRNDVMLRTLPARCCQGAHQPPYLLVDQGLNS